MGIQDGTKQFLEIFLVCLYMLPKASTSAVDHGVMRREVTIGVLKDPLFSPHHPVPDFHPTHEEALSRYSLHGISYPGRNRKHLEAQSRRKRRSAPGSSASEVEEGSVDRRRELYNDFLRRVLRKNRQKESKKENTAANSKSEKNKAGTDATKDISLKSSPAPVTHHENRNRTSGGRMGQTINTGLQSERPTLPTPVIRRAYTLSAEQREVRRQILIKRNREERLQRLRELHESQNTARRRKASTKRKNVRERVNNSSRPRVSTNGIRSPVQKHSYKMNTGAEKLTRSTVKPKKNVIDTPTSQENHSRPRQGRNKGKKNVSDQRGTNLDNNILALEPTKANPFISAPRANDYLTRLDSVAERKKYPRRAILTGKTKDDGDSSAPPTPIAIPSRSNSRRRGTEHEKRLNQKKNGNEIESTRGAKLTPNGRHRSGKSGPGRRTRISKNDKKRIRRIRKNRLKMRQRKRRNNRKRKHRNRKSRTGHKLSSTNPTSTPVAMTSTSKIQILSTGPDTFSSINKRQQRKDEHEMSTTSFLTTTTRYRNRSFITFITSSTPLERPNEYENVNNASVESPIVNKFNKSVIEDMQMTRELDSVVNNSAGIDDTIAARDDEIKRTGEHNDTTTDTPHQTDPLNLLPTATAYSSFPPKGTTAKVSDVILPDTNYTHIMPHNGTASDVGTSQEVSDGNANELYNTSVGSIADAESLELSNGNANELHNSPLGSIADDKNLELSNGNANQLYNTSIRSDVHNESYPLNEEESSDLNNTTKTRKVLKSATEGTTSSNRLLTDSTKSTNMVTPSTREASQSVALHDKDKSTGETSPFPDISKLATTTASLTSSHSSKLSLPLNENDSSIETQSENQISPTASDNQTSIVYGNSDKDKNDNNNTYKEISSNSLPREMSSSSPSSTTAVPSSLSDSKTTTNPYASRWIAWAKRRRKKSKNGSKSGTKSGKSSQESEGMAHGSVALALAKAEKDQSGRLSSSRRPMTEPTTTKGPFIGYKTAYDFLSNQKGVKVSVLNENRRESRDINKFMGENMCEIFNKHYVPTRIGGKCV